jgi:hypothetical protein
MCLLVNITKLTKGYQDQNHTDHYQSVPRQELLALSKKQNDLLRSSRVNVRNTSYVNDFGVV